MKTGFASQSNAKLGHARVDSRITSIDMMISLNTRVKHFGQNLSQRVTYCESGPRKGHPKSERRGLLEALGVSPYVVPKLVIVLGQSLRQILGEEHRVVLPKHKPPHARELQRHKLGHNARHADRVPRSPLSRVAKPGGVLGDAHRREEGGVAA